VKIIIVIILIATEKREQFCSQKLETVAQLSLIIGHLVHCLVTYQTLLSVRISPIVLKMKICSFS